MLQGQSIYMNLVSGNAGDEKNRRTGGCKNFFLSTEFLK